VTLDAESQTGGRFPATRWSAIVAARSPDAAERAHALNALLAAYWKPVFKYIRLRWNRQLEDAQDLTQGFFAALLERDLLAKYDPEKSRLRTFLRLCVDGFVLNQDKAANRQKRGGGALHVALDFPSAESELGHRALDPAAMASPESLEVFFEKEWVRSLFELAVDDLQRLCAGNGKSRAFQLFEKYDLEEQNEYLSYAQRAKEFSMTASEVTNALAWARREFRRIALERLRETCASDADFRRESRALFGREAR